ncbi:type IV secretory system conjugative DNA transfer family protein [Streptomyces sp. NPDC058644]|uniref:type IV secretory system conjugative DNA transfer family protein n=1 Tax=unclassified Streptomyces TaxID=2593676 RepID=UPI0036604AB4
MVRSLPPAPGAGPHLAAPPSPWERYLRDPAGAAGLALDQLAGLLRQWGLLTLGALFLAAGLVAGIRRWWSRRRHRVLMHNARLVGMLPPPQVDAAGAAALWANLVGLLRPAWLRVLSGQPHLAWEYVIDRDSVRIQLWVPGSIPPGLVERAIEAAWPGAHTHSRPATPHPTAGLQAATGELRLARCEALPLRTDFPLDPLRALLGAPAGLAPGERAVVQILARPVTGRRVINARRRARHTRAAASTPVLARLLDGLTPGRPRTVRNPAAANRQAVLETSAADRAIVAKQRGAQYETRIRYAVTSPAAHQAGTEERGQVRALLRGRAHAIASAFAPYTEHNFYRRTRPRRLLEQFAQRRLGRGDLLSVAELAAVAHLPWDHAVPGLQRAGARAVPPPPGIARPGPAAKPLGLTDTGRPRPVGLRIDDARHHTHILGATGSGKSELLGHLVLADAGAGRGQVVIDPKGDLVADILARLPADLGKKIVLFDADSKLHPPVLNPLEGQDAARTVDNLVSIFSRVYASSWGPRTDDILRAGLLTLRSLPGTPTLTDLPHLLSVPALRRRAVGQIHDEVLRGFWSWYEDLTTPARAQVTAPLMNKLRGFLLRPFVREALAGGPSTVDMEHVLDHGGICLVRIARDTLGAETAHLVGSVIVARTWQAATRRARLRPSQRPDASLYVDEAHHFLNLPYPLQDMLAEARGYRLSMTLAHQYLRQLPPELAEGISTNARTKIFFNASPEDARHLARHTQPRLGEHDLSHLDAFHAVVRLVLHGAEVPAFTALTQPLPPPTPGLARRNRAAAHHNARPAPPPPGPRPPGPGPVDPRRTAPPARTPPPGGEPP